MFRVGTHIQVGRLGYTHHGIYVGRNQVVHYSGFHEFGGKGSVSITTLSEFCDGQQAQEYPRARLLKGSAFLAEEIVCRAKSRLGEDSYNVFFNNCEHFANWCTHGDSYSAQTAGTVENNVRSGNYLQLGGLTLFDFISHFKGLFK
ncbi:lecithin retinol acyltransferase family protein [Archangium sp. Cb G35]|uniref:lecithin retinol acyltransferase family protein n=1 Tax=Archangium sp. Cb G35 TaxID=1920190 RepID=UPI0009376B78|nr:lecithin retinol acyltransferase family protein [Archangium sp. Cb G35]